MNRLTDYHLEALNDTLAAAMSDRGYLGSVKAATLHQLCCEVQAWRRAFPSREYNPNDHEVIPLEPL